MPPRSASRMYHALSTAVTLRRHGLHVFVPCHTFMSVVLAMDSPHERTDTWSDAGDTLLWCTNASSLGAPHRGAQTPTLSCDTCRLHRLRRLHAADLVTTRRLLHMSTAIVLFLVSDDTHHCGHLYDHLLRRTNASSKRYTSITDERHLLLWATHAHRRTMLAAAHVSHTSSITRVPSHGPASRHQ
ncbi:hypothetical protein GUJ93_ZPchr0012g18962 [Zizania palustris]|uniref:Uncharacterized protein n=1 Tax=Zizania palustris TaxID=103762 RepID=A0A8J6BTH8_ZIZPA|nr:hypothetical protein GUJ93_ZPchr0012g18962 [Zizania palustris]